MLSFTAPTRTIDCDEIATTTEFVHLSTLSDIRVDLRYATSDNFMQRNMYSPHDCAWLHRDAAGGLMRARDWLNQHAPQSRPVTLLVLDALRPHRVQEAMWNALEGTPLTQYLADPARGSIHSYGMAVDVTLIGANDEALDMGTLFDEMTELSHPTLENDFLKSGDLNAVQVSNRHLLRDAMKHGGFNGIPTEWWHFDCGDRDRVRTEFVRVN
jgi:zinc D-Ala-D-Ala dipeptidase